MFVSTSGGGLLPPPLVVVVFCVLQPQANIEWHSTKATTTKLDRRHKGERVPESFPLVAESWRSVLTCQVANGAV